MSPCAHRFHNLCNCLPEDGDGQSRYTQKRSRDWHSSPAVYIKSFYGIPTWLIPGLMITTGFFPTVQETLYSSRAFGT